MLNDLTRRQFLGFSGGVAALLGLAGCSSGGDSAAGSDAGSASAAVGGGTLTVGLSGNPVNVVN